MGKVNIERLGLGTDRGRGRTENIKVVECLERKIEVSSRGDFDSFFKSKEKKTQNKEKNSPPRMVRRVPRD